MSSRYEIDESAEVKSGSGLWGNDVIPFRCAGNQSRLTTVGTQATAAK
jgi:hypothetical protein